MAKLNPDKQCMVNLIPVYKALGFHILKVEVDAKGKTTYVMGDDNKRFVVKLPLDSISDITYKGHINSLMNIGKFVATASGRTAITSSDPVPRDDYELLQLTLKIVERNCTNRFGKLNEDYAIQYGDLITRGTRFDHDLIIGHDGKESTLEELESDRKYQYFVKLVRDLDSKSTWMVEADFKHVMHPENHRANRAFTETRLTDYQEGNIKGDVNRSYTEDFVK